MFLRSRWLAIAGALLVIVVATGLYADDDKQRSRNGQPS